MRISRQHMFMEMAEVAAMRSTCFRGNVGAIVVKDNDILAMGYNGPPAGEDHCLGNHCPQAPAGGCGRSVHAEHNAIARAMSKTKSSLAQCDVYCTYSPCPDCATKIFNAYARRLFYRYSYRVPLGLEFLLKQNVAVYRITSAGYIISEKTKMIIDAGDLT